MVSRRALGLLTVLFVGCVNLIQGRDPVCAGFMTVWCTALSFMLGWGGGAAICTPIMYNLCDRRRRAIPDLSEIEKFDKMGKLYTFPQSFADYHPDDGTISVDKFIVGVQKVLPAHLHHYAALAEAFDKADVNDDGQLDETEFQKGSWMAEEEDLTEVKYQLIADGVAK